MRFSVRGKAQREVGIAVGSTREGNRGGKMLSKTTERRFPTEDLGQQP